MPETSELLRLLRQHSPAQAVLSSRPGDRGLADEARFPFLALVSQIEMKTALILTLINPAVGGVLLVGPRGTGKTTAVRGLVDILPQVQRSTCPNGCEPQAAEVDGMDGVCPSCAAKLIRGEPISALDRMRLFELPLNARLDDVVGGINERIAMEQHKVRLERGLLAMADQNLLYVDEVNLLADEIADAILDAAAQGMYTVRRGPLAATYRARIVLVGSMNPEEGKLRPQIQDRFGLRVLVRGLTDSNDRLEVYRRVTAYRANPHALRATWAAETFAAAAEIAKARPRLPQVKLTPQVERTGIAWIKRMGIDSHRAEIVLFEAARAYAAADERTQVNLSDLRAVAAIALRQRRSPFMDDYFGAQADEEQEIASVVHGSTKPTHKRSRR
jgi:magnesium chelatase subunit I